MAMVNLNQLCRLLALTLCVTPLVDHAQAANDKEADAKGIEFFENRIRPVLVKHCYACHSVEKKKKQGGLMLDTRAGIRRGGDSGPAVSPGNPDESLILAALRYQDGLEMPPKGKLPSKAIKDVERWIRIGAPDPREGGEEADGPVGVSIEEGRKFWSFQPIHDPEPPETLDANWPSNSVDSFLLAKQESAGLSPAADANLETVLRRLHFDLVGLPPSPNDVHDFLNAAVQDRSMAIEEVVDRLLASPRFGERWGRHWLDLVRFSESSGGGRTRVFTEAWRYRDYVIQAFNEDKPYDQFVKEQIAGDLLKFDSTEAAQAALTGTSFLAIGPINYELQDKQLLDMEVVDEQLNTIGKSMLAMTIGCARCHDHKFDPIPTADYYALAGIFLSTKSLNHSNVSNPVMRQLPLDKESQERQRVAKRIIEPLETQIKTIAGKINSLSKTTVGNSIPLKTLAGVVIDDEQANYVENWTASTSIGGYINAGYHHQKSPTAEAHYKTKLQPGRYEVRISHTASSNRPTNTAVRVWHADGIHESQINQRKRGPIGNTFVSLGMFHFNETATVVLGGKPCDGVMIADAVQFIPVAADTTDSAARAISSFKSQSGDNAKDKQADKERQAQLVKLNQQLKSLQVKLNAAKSKHKLRAVPVVMSVEESSQIRDCEICIRGNVHNRGRLIRRGFLSVLPHSELIKIPKKASGRLQFAEWIADSRNSLTARVFANRVWHWIMGTGIVRTVDNFGAMGEKPSHPELLDHLATRFMRNGWSVKKLIKYIVLSRSYQLSSRPTEKVRTIDPENRLLSHMPRRRLDAEAIRDAILSATMQIDLAVGGSTIRKGTSSEFNYQFNDDAIDGRRRSVYVPVFRNSLLDLFEVFDFADPNLVVGRRPVSTLPTQGLYLLNSPWVMAKSEQLAGSILSNEKLATQEQKLDETYLRLFGRFPKPGERQVANNFLGKSTDRSRWSSLIHTLIASVDFRYLE